MNCVFCVLVILTGASQTRGQGSALPPVLTLAALPGHAGNSASLDLTEGPGNEVPQRTHNPVGKDETSIQASAVIKTKGTVHSGTVAITTSGHADVPVVTSANPGTPPPSAAAGSLSSRPTVQSTAPPQHFSTTGGRALLTRDPLTTMSSQPARTVPDTTSTAHASTLQPQSESLAAGHHLTSAPGRGPAGPTHQAVPSELNVGDEDLKGPRYHSSSPLDPLLAGLLSVFIVTTAIAFVVLFLKFRQRTNHPEFHRLQDLPMDDLMEDTPLSRYTY